MLSRLYVIRDIIADDLFGGIIRVNNDEVARRNFHDALTAEQGPFKGHEADYDLIYLGTIDHQGLIVDINQTVVARGADWIAANNQNPELLK